MSFRLDSLPPSIVNVHLKFPANHTRHPMTQPNCPQKSIVPLLVQKQLSTVSQSRIHLAILIDIRRDHPRTRGMVEVKNRAFADIDEEANVLLALQHMLLCATNLLGSATPIRRTLLQAADALSAGDYTTEKTEHWIADVLASGRATSLHRLFHQRVVILGQADEFEDSWVTQRNLGRWIMRWRVGVHDPSLD